MTHNDRLPLTVYDFSPFQVFAGANVASAPPCASSQSNMFACIQTNALVCGFSCMQGQLSAINANTGNCTNNIGFCAASTCCTQCAGAIDLYKECLLTSCDTSCPSITPFAPTPNTFPPPSPSGGAPSDDDGVSSECEASASAFKLCIFANIEACMTSCAVLGEGGESAEVTCQDVPYKCQEAMCCPACIAQGKAFVECEAGLLACDEDCSDVAPIAPSPTVPTPSFPPYDAGGEDDAISPECIETLVAFSACFEQNVGVCESSCSNLDDAKNSSDPFSCDSAQTQCKPATCCASCAALGKAVVACETNARGCPESCSGLSTPEQPSSTPEQPSSTLPTSGSSASTKFVWGLLAVTVMHAYNSF